MKLIQRILPFSSSTTTVHAYTYLLAVCLFSISFLVFLNAVISFVITDLIGVKHRVGDHVGTLGFVDELIAIIACPFWGILSDRLGVRYVCVAGYTVIAISLFIFVQARNVYPQLLLARAFFSIGGAATATMVTGILPAVSGITIERGTDTTAIIGSDHLHSSTSSTADSQTIISSKYNHRSNNGQTKRNDVNPKNHPLSSSPRLAGLVGFFTGCGALVALIVFLPLPAQFSRIKGVTQGQAIAYSFYVVGTISLVVAFVCFFGLKNMNGEEGKGWHLLFHKIPNYDSYEPITSGQNERDGLNPVASPIPYSRLLLDSAILGFRDPQIGLGYIGGFVARASSVGISLFIPTYVNAFFAQNGLCNVSPNDPSSQLKKECRAAYILASELTGISQLFALLFAPIFGYLSDRSRRLNIPILLASFLGIIGYTGFARLESPEPKDINGRGGSPIVFLFISLIGISQIGAIVCSLGLLGTGILDGDYKLTGPIQNIKNTPNHVDINESSPLIPSEPENHVSRSHLKGSVAGLYSLFGGVAILLLTKLGGYLFDNASKGAPFYMMSVFNGLLLIYGTGIAIFRNHKSRLKPLK